MTKKPNLYQILYSEIDPIIAFIKSSQNHSLHHQIAIFKDTNFNNRHYIISTTEELDKVIIGAGGVLVNEYDQYYIHFQNITKVLIFGDEILAKFL